jgi:acetyl-CoA synthetase
LNSALQRLIAPRRIALIGAGAWTDAVAAGASTLGFTGTLWRVHPSRPSTEAARIYRSVSELPGAPDAAFIAVPGPEVAAVAAGLATLGAGGFVCFSAGFSETGTEAGERLTRDLGRAAAGLPYFGPNCYGFVNFLDRAALWPDQVVGPIVERGVALICQSGTIALTLMFNDRSLPIGQIFTVGNQTRLAVEDLIEFLCGDPRITAFGLYLEGVHSTERFARAADQARVAGKPIALIKTGRTPAAAAAVRSHTGALAGSDSVFDAFCRQAGIARCDTLGALCETLKLLHAGGPLPGNRVLIMGPSGGDMAMTADVARSFDLEFPPLPAARAATLRALLGGRVTPANPFDINTYHWFDPPALERVFAEALESGYDAVGFMLDSPPEAHADTAAFDAVIDVFIDAARGHPAARGGTRAALIASLPETISARIRQDCLDNGLAPLQGQREALEALALAGAVGAAWRAGPGPRLQMPSLPFGSPSTTIRTLSEHDGKAALAEFGVRIPRGVIAAPGATADAAVTLGFPVVIKAVGPHIAHKSDRGGLAVNVRTVADAIAAGERLRHLSHTLLVEEMIGGGVAEVLVGVASDAQFGQVLVLGAGGVLTELLADSVSILPPWSRDAVRRALERLAVWKLMSGYRGRPQGDVEALVGTVLDICRFASAHVDSLVELDVNPVIVLPAGAGAVAVDALIRLDNSD